MSELENRKPAFATCVATKIGQASGLVQKLAQPWLTQLVLRLALSVPFWRSGILKWHGFLQLNDTAIDLFTDVFQLHLPGGPYPFPVLLVLGFGTRFAALGLFLMTCTIELTVPDGWPIHITWAAMALGIAAWGPGAISIDHLLSRAVKRS